MSEFSSSVELLVQPSSSSLRDARREIEESLGDVEVDVSTTGASSKAARSKDSQFAGKERAMSRQLLSTSNTHLETVTDHLGEGLELDETRNDLLRELIDETESGNFTQAKGGGGALGLLAGGLGLAALAPAVAGKVGEVLSNIDFSTVLPKVDVSAEDVIGTAATVSAPALVGVSATVLAEDVIGNKAHIGVGDVVGVAAEITAEDVIQAAVTITAGSVIGTSATILADHVIDTAAELRAKDVIGVAATVSAPALVGVEASIQAADLVAEKANIEFNDVVNIPEGGIGLMELLGVGAAAGGSAALWRLLQGGGSGSAAASAGAGMPVIAPEWLPEGSAFRTNPATGEDVAPSILTAQGRQQRLGGFGEWLNTQLGTPANPQDSSQHFGSPETARERYDRRSGGGTDVTVNAQFDHARSDREIERLIDRKLQSFRRDLEREFGRR